MSMDLKAAVTGFSLAAQMIAAVLALRLIRRTGQRAPGLVILAAVFLMAFRRAISFYRLLAGGAIKVDIAAEATGLTISLLLVLGILYVTRLIVSEMEIVDQLHQAMRNVKVLTGLLPICASCKKIRDDQGYWKQIETYIKEHSEADFTHSICPKCAKVLYPTLRRGF